MSQIPRREFLGFLMGGATLAAAGASLTSTAVIAAPFPVDTASSSLLESPLEEAAVRTTCWWHRGRRVCRRVRRVCWWRGGRRVCVWR
jgi:hypothetical protein